VNAGVNNPADGRAEASPDRRGSGGGAPFFANISNSSYPTTHTTRTECIFFFAQGVWMLVWTIRLRRAPIGGAAAVARRRPKLTTDQVSAVTKKVGLTLTLWSARWVKPFCSRGLARVNPRPIPIYLYLYVLGEWVDPHRERQTTPQGQTSSPPKSFLTPTAKARPNQAAIATAAETPGTTHRARPRSPK